jgi:TRAP-type C4-dicarboxylate transport system substrate-binding protein
MQHSWGAAENFFFQQYADIVKEMSNGRIEIQVFSDGELMSFDEVGDAVANGTLEMGHTHPDYYEGVVPEGFLESAPYLWRTLEEELAVIYKFGIGDIYTEALEETFGYKVIGFEPDDSGAILFNKDIKTLADFKGTVINILDPTASILSKLTGCSTTYLGPEELYTAMALGVIDGVEYGGAKSMLALSLQEVGKTFVEPHHQLAYFPFYFINRDLWNEMPSDLQAILREGVMANGMYMKYIYSAGEAEALEIFREAGVKEVWLPDEDVDAIFQEAVKWLTEEYASYTPRCAEAAEICINALKIFGRI